MRIRIIKTPLGEAPEEVKREWVGLELPCDQTGSEGDFTFEAKSLKEVANPRENVFFVPQDKAIAILERKSAKAARWFREAGYPIPLMYFTFGFDEAVII